MRRKKGARDEEAKSFYVVSDCVGHQNDDKGDLPR